MLRNAIIQIARLVLNALGLGTVLPHRAPSIDIDDADLAQRVRLTGEW